ncbi:MAG: hypothetical protein ACI841_003030 [Planctomycetota bacterium]|jgi:hypothetical protein
MDKIVSRNPHPMHWIRSGALVLAASAILVSAAAQSKVLEKSAEPAPHASAGAAVVLIQGVEGTSEYGQEFGVWIERLKRAATDGGTALHRIGHGAQPMQGATTDRERLKSLLAELSVQTQTPLWIIYCGHGSYDGQDARWNLRGPDVGALELQAMLQEIQRPIALVVCAAASGPFVNAISAPNRVVISATKSGLEYSYARFGDAFSSAFEDLAADLDKDQQVSLLEAYLYASSRVAQFYQAAGRLATEHALLDDNADGRGTPASWFRGTRVIRVAKDGSRADGALAHQWHLHPSERERALPAVSRAERDALELKLEALRAGKEQLGTRDYDAQLETILVSLARIYARQIPGND